MYCGPVRPAAPPPRRSAAAAAPAGASSAFLADLQALNVLRLATTLVCIYYLNESLTVLQTNPLFAAVFPFSSDGVWQQHVAWVDASNLCGGAAAVCCLLGICPLSCGMVMLCDTLIDSYLLLCRIGMSALYGRGLYINEVRATRPEGGTVDLQLARMVPRLRRRVANAT